MADLLGITRGAVYAMVQRGQIPFIRLGSGRRGRIRFSKPTLVEWLRHKSIAITTERAA